MLSSHILSEVQAVCDSIMIISKGRLVASDTAENLTALFAGKTTLKLEIKSDREQAQAVLAQVPDIDSVDWSDGEAETVRAEVHPTDNADLRETLFTAFAEKKLPLLELTRVRASLEDVFLELTGGEASDTQNTQKAANEQPESTLAASPEAEPQPSEEKEASAE